MKIIDRKALVAALIMACGNVACASGSDDLFSNGTPGVGAGSGVGVDRNRSDEFKAHRHEQIECLSGIFKMSRYEMSLFMPLQEKFEALSPEAREGIKSIFEPCEGVEDRKIISAAFRALTVHQIQAIGLYARALLFPQVYIRREFVRDDGTYGYSKECIIRALGRLTVDKINAIGENAGAIFIDNMNVGQRVYVIHAFSDVETAKIRPKVDAIDALRKAGTLFIDSMNGNSLSCIIHAFVGVEADDIQPKALAIDAFRDDRTLFTIVMSEYNRVSIISALVPLNVHQIKAIGENAGALFTKDMEWKQRECIISALAPLNVDQIQDVAKKMTTGMTVKQRLEIIENFKKEPEAASNVAMSSGRASCSPDSGGSAGAASAALPKVAGGAFGIMTVDNEALLLKKMGRVGPLDENDYCAQLEISYKKESKLVEVLEEIKKEGVLTESFISKVKEIFGNKRHLRESHIVLKALFETEKKGFLTESVVQELKQTPLALEKDFVRRVKSYIKKSDGGTGGASGSGSASGFVGE